MKLPRLSLQLLLIILLASALRLYKIDFQSLWDDEIATMIEADPELSLGETYFYYRNFDSIPPLYIGVLKYIFMFTSYSALVLRLLSALLSIAAVYLTYLLGRQLHSQRAGIFAATILAVNYFQIMYAQEGRPYAYLSFFTLLSFYRLVLHIKAPSRNNALYYGAATVMMLYGHYYALFIAVAQGLLLVFFGLRLQPQQRKKFAAQLLLAACIGILSYIPAMPQLLRNAGISSSWIPAPENDVFTQYFLLFFGKSELVVALVYLFLVLYFVHLTRRDEAVTYPLVNLSSQQMAFLILSFWIAIYLLIPLARSYMVLPMLVSRYFTLLIPAIAILAGIGLDQIKSNLINYSLIGFFTVFSVNDIVVVNKFYRTLYKADYRSSSKFVLDNYSAGEDVVATVGWHYGHFFNRHSPKIPVQWMNLDSYVNQLIGKKLPASFWYVGVHEAQPNLSEAAKQFLENNYCIDKRNDYFETNAIHFARKPKNSTPLPLSNFTGFNVTNTGVIVLDGSKQAMYQALHLAKGSYRLNICARSMPQTPVNNINAHLTLNLGGKNVGGCFINNPVFCSLHSIPFYVPADTTVHLELQFDNDLQTGKDDRNMAFASVFVTKL